jgi:hypothetical protein
MAEPSFLKEIKELLDRELGLRDDGAQRADREILAVHGYDHPHCGFVQVSQDVMAPLM